MRKTLDEFQDEIRAKIKAKGLELTNGDNSKIEPIYDGLSDIDAYEAAPVKIMWVLKEAYCDFDENGNPIGGGWSIPDIWKDSQHFHSIIKNRTWKPMMYVLGSLSEGSNWDDLEWIENDPEKYIKYLQGCAYININKFPANSHSGSMADKFSIWQNLLKEQIEGYSPDVIIFGYTYQNFLSAFWEQTPVSLDGISGVTDAYITSLKGKPVLLIDAYHPNNRVKGLTQEKYVDTIVETVKQNLNKIK